MTAGTAPPLSLSAAFPGPRAGPSLPPEGWVLRWPHTWPPLTLTGPATARGLRPGRWARRLSNPIRPPGRAALCTAASGRRQCPKDHPPGPPWGCPLPFVRKLPKTGHEGARSERGTGCLDPWLSVPPRPAATLAPALLLGARPVTSRLAPLGSAHPCGGLCDPTDSRWLPLPLQGAEASARRVQRSQLTRAVAQGGRGPCSGAAALSSRAAPPAPPAAVRPALCFPSGKQQRTGGHDPLPGLAAPHVLSRAPCPHPPASAASLPSSRPKC